MYGSVEGLFILNGDLGISYVNLFIKSKTKAKLYIPIQKYLELITIF